MPKCWLSLLPSRGSPRRPWVATLHENARRQNGVDGGQNRHGGEDVGQVPFPGQLHAAVAGGARQHQGAGGEGGSDGAARGAGRDRQRGVGRLDRKHAELGDQAAEETGGGDGDETDPAAARGRAQQGGGGGGEGGGQYVE